MAVDPKFHPKIIGRKGAVISQIRKDHDVNVQFPDKGDEDQVGASAPLRPLPGRGRGVEAPLCFKRWQDLIVISGYERNVEEARHTIQQLVAELQEMVSQDVHLDPRTHARIIGARGKAIRKLMEEFKVPPSPRTLTSVFPRPVLSVARFPQVDIRFPPPGSDEPDKVMVMGLPDTVDNAIDHLLNLEEEYVRGSRNHSLFFFFFFLRLMFSPRLFRCST